MRRGLELGVCCAFVGTFSFGALSCSRKANAVVCTVTYGGEARRLEFPATTSPYTVTAVDVAARFRFKVIYVREPGNAASINVYVYQRAETGDALLQEGKYTPPFSLGTGAHHGFSGRQLVYSSEQRELEYWCELSR